MGNGYGKSLKKEKGHLIIKTALTGKEKNIFTQASFE